MDLRDTARAFAEAGCSVVPARPDGTKAPAAFWKRYQTQRPSIQEIEDWLGGDAYDGIGLVCGAVSGNLEMLELEGRAVAEGLVQQLQAALDEHGLGELWQRLNNGYLEVTPSHGLHWLYRVDGITRSNLKLARRPSTAAELVAAPQQKIQVLIETRGEGGYVVVAPSGGRTHPSGTAWALAAGGPASIPVLSEDERDALHAIASTFDQMPIEEPRDNPAYNMPGRDIPAGQRPGDDYNLKADWTAILNGWTRVGSIGSGYGWRRPGKDRGISATTGTSSDGADRLYVFSTSTDFQTEKPYSKFAAYTLLEHGGDWGAAAKQLRRDGYGGPLPAPGSDPVLRLVHNNDSATAKTDGSIALAPDVQARIHAGLTDVGNADLLVANHHDKIRYVPERGRWLAWSGHRWIWDDAGRVIELAKQTILDIDTTDDDAYKHQKRSLSRRAVEAMVALARTDGAITVHFAELDAQPYALCTPNNVIDLRTGKGTTPLPQDLHTRSTRVVADPACPTPMWTGFLEQTFDDPQMIGFVQRLAGYSAGGIVSRHVLPFLHGPGGNGKSVFLDVLRSLLGDYAGAAPAKFLMAGQQQHETEVARLAGLRLVICSEVNQDDRFDEAKVKLLTGGDALTARFMRQDHFTFEPTHHLWLMGNHQPKVAGGGESFWRRLRMLPFTNTVAPEDKIEGLAQLLIEQEGPGILAWVVTGAVMAQESLSEPEAVMAATRLYADEEDALARFMTDRVTLGGGRQIKLDTAVLRRAYEEWCRDEGEKPVSPQVLGRELRTRYDVEQVRSHGHRLYVGMALVVDEEDAPEPHWSDR